jgi:hypothetical protein
VLNKEGNEYYFEYSATLRIFGQNLDHEAITATLGLEPTYMHKQGDIRRSNRPYEYVCGSMNHP